MFMKKRRIGLKLKKRAKLLLVTAAIASGLLFTLNSKLSNVSVFETEQLAYAEKAEEKFVYISDLEYITANNWSYVSWGSIQKDRPPEGEYISLIVNGRKRLFAKGMGLHANAVVTYDVSELSSKYTRFVGRVGIDASRGSTGNGVWFQFLVSNDGNDWISLQKTGVVKGDSESLDIDVNIEGYKYFRILINQNGSNAADHGVVANGKLVTDDFVPSEFADYSKIHDIDYYDKILSAHDADYNMKNNYRLILERAFADKFNYDMIQILANLNDKTKATLDWILSSNENLELAIEVGNISNSKTFITALADLYTTYGSELSKENGDVYKKMMFGQAAAYSTDKASSPLTFNHKAPAYDYVERYGIFKELYDAGLFQYGNGFKQYHVEMFRIMMNGAARNDELRWLNYIGKAKNYSTGVYTYVGRANPNYSKSSKPHLYDIANKEKYDTKYHLSEYGVPFADDTTRYWMVMEAAGICWNQARFTMGAIMMMGRPSVTAYQPEHEVALFYGAQNADGTGRGSWGVAGNIFGWGSTSNSWYGGNKTRTLFGWSYKSFVNHVVNGNGAGTSAGYIYLAQDNLERYADYKKSVYLNLLANSYENKEDKIAIYNKSLEVDNINLDTYDYKIQVYKAANKSSEEWYKLAQDIIKNYTYYPMAMNDLLKLIKPYLNGTHKVDIDQSEYAALKTATKATTANVYQNGACQSIANAILKKTKANLASFSFDGDNAGKIVLDKAYDSFTDIQWHYSLDGGHTQSAGTVEHSVQLSSAEIAKITAENDIQIYIDGMLRVAYTIDIVNGTLPTNLYGNDLENRVIGVDLTFEWAENENGPWTSYKTASPNNNGDSTIYVRVGATGNKLASPSAKFTFTEDNQPDTEKYIPINHLSIKEYSSQSVDTGRPFYAPNAIDGNIHTMWHTDFRYNVISQGVKPFLVIELDRARYISALEFVQQQYKVNDPDFIKNALVYVSEDGENWREPVARMNNCAKNEEFKKIKFEDSVYGKFVKFETETYDMFSSAAMINLFEDITKVPPTSAPTANIAYSVTDSTNGDVVARLVNPSADIEILNNDGSDTVTFTENDQQFTFEFKDKATGLIGYETAHVTWIDKVAPTAEIDYSTKFPTNGSVVATLKASEEVIVTNNGEYRINDEGKLTNKDGVVIPGYTVDKKGDIYDANNNLVSNMNTFTHEFIANGYFTFEFKDFAGNKGSATAEVTWIDTDAPDGELFYEIVGPTNKDVVVNISFDEENVKVLNNEGKTAYAFTENGEFTFEFEDAAGNSNSLTARVSWIDKVAPTAKLTYEKVGDKIIVRVVDASKEIAFQDGNGTYEYDTNGNYDIVFSDKAGNTTKLVAVIEGLKNPVVDNTQNPGNNNTSSKPNSGTNSSTNTNTNKPSKPNTSSNVGTNNSSEGNNNNQVNEGNNTTNNSSVNNNQSTNGNNNSGNNGGSNSTNAISENKPVEKQKTPIAMYFILAAAVVALATGIFIIRKKDDTLI